MTSKAAAMREYFKIHPDAEPKVVAKKYKVSVSAAYAARKVKPEPRARKSEPQYTDVIDHIKTIRSIGVERVRKIMELL